MIDSDFERHSVRHSREFEAQMLVEVMRLSRVAVLYGSDGADKTTLLTTGVLPLLRLHSQDRADRHGETGEIASSSDPQSEIRATDRGSDVAIIFDRWESAPLVGLRSRIGAALRSDAGEMAEPHSGLAECLAAWNRALGVRFFIILDGFEQYLRAPLDRAGIADFECELVRIINAPGLAVHFLISVRDDAEGLLLSRFRGRISGLEDAFVRLPRMQPIASSSLGSSQSDWPAIAATAAAAGREDGPRQSAIEDSPVNALKPMRGLLGRGGNEPTIDDRVQLYRNTQRASNLFIAKGRGAATRTQAPRKRRALRRSVRRFIQTSLAAVVAGLAIGLGAIHFTVSQNHPPPQAASVPGGPALVTVPVADLSPAPVISPLRAGPPEPSNPQERIFTPDEPVSPPGSSTSIQNAKGKSATRQGAPRIAQPEAVSVASAAAGDWRNEMRRELDTCRLEGWFARVMCTESVRWKRCAPDRWNRIPECMTNVQLTSSD